MTRSRAGQLPARVAVAAWLVVFLVGVLVLGIVFSLGLFGRLGAGQRVVDRLSPPFTSERVTGAAAGTDILSSIVNLADPLVTPAGGAAAEVPKLVAFVAAKTGLSETAVLDTLNTNFPALTNLIQALPLSSVTAELPGLIEFLSGILKLTPDQVSAALATGFPHLSQAITNLPAVTNGWENVPDLGGVTRFDGSPVRTVPQVRDYLRGDVVPVLTAERTNFARLRWFPPVGSIAGLLTVVGAVVALLGLIMMLLSARGAVTPGLGLLSWGVVLLVGVVVLLVVFGLRLFPRLDGGQKVVDAARPAFTQARVNGDVGGVKMVSTIVNLADPLVTPTGGAAGEVPRLIEFVSASTGLSPEAVTTTLLTKAPAVTHLLQALPLSAVAAEIPAFEDFLATTLKMSKEQVRAALTSNFPALTQSITNLPTVAGQWDKVAGTAGFTRYNGTPVTTVKQVRDYFKDDLVPTVARTAPDLRKLDKNPKLTLFPPLLTIIGVIVVLFALLMLVLTRRFAAQAGAPAVT